MFYVYNSITGEFIGKLDFKTIQKKKFDTQSFSIIKEDEYKNFTGDVPRAVIEAYCESKEKTKLVSNGKYFKKVFVPIFEATDYDCVYISGSGHFILKNSLSPAQLLWMEAESKGNKILN